MLELLSQEGTYILERSGKNLIVVTLNGIYFGCFLEKRENEILNTFKTWLSNQEVDVFFAELQYKKGTALCEKY